MTTINRPAAQAGSYRVGDLDLNRIGYGAMQLAGPGVFGPPRDREAAIEVLRTAVELGVNHIDTAGAYGPDITNEIIREAHIAYVPYFPLGGFSPLQSDVLESVAKRLGATQTAVALSWLRQRSPNIMLIPGTSSVDHLRENIAGAAWPCRPTSPSWTGSEQRT